MHRIAFKLRRASSGLGLLLAGLLISVTMQVLLAVVVAATLVGQMNAAPQPLQVPPQPNFQGNGVILLVGVGAMFLVMGRTIDLIGQFRCLALVGEFPGAKFLSLSLFFQVLAFLGTVWEAMQAPNGPLPPPPPMVVVEEHTAGVSSQVCFLLFLYGLGAYIQRADLAARARALLFHSIGVAVPGVASFLLMKKIPVLAFVALGCTFYAVVLFFRYLHLLAGLRVATLRFAEALENHVVGAELAGDDED